jgi:Na+/melibiose symporter-like transporter
VTPIVGLYSDKFNTRIGKRKPWYIAGTIIVTIAFGFIWQDCLICMYNDSIALKVFWYALFASLFNIGWACVQISHMSMIPQLSARKSRRNILIGLRTAFTYISNVIVLSLAFILFNTVSVPME